MEIMNVNWGPRYIKRVAAPANESHPDFWDIECRGAATGYLMTEDGLRLPVYFNVEVSAVAVAAPDYARADQILAAICELTPAVRSTE